MGIVFKEAPVQRACLDYLAAERIWHVRTNVGAFGGESAKGKRWFVKFGKPGMADILVSIRMKEFIGDCHGQPTFVWVECKRPSGKQSADQVAFQLEVEREGHIYMLVDDVDHLRDWMNNWRAS